MKKHRNSKHRETPKEELAGYLKKGMTHRQISEHTNIPVNTISMRIYRCGLNKKDYKQTHLMSQSKAAVGEELNDGFKDLFAAIYLQAVRDDCIAVRKSLAEELEGQAGKLEIADYIKAKMEYIDMQVKKGVLQESEHYGGDTRAIQKSNIERLVNELAEGFLNGG